MYCIHGMVVVVRVWWEQKGMITHPLPQRVLVFIEKNGEIAIVVLIMAK